MPGLTAGTAIYIMIRPRPGAPSATHFDVGFEKIEAVTNALTIEQIEPHRLQVGHDPAQFMRRAVPPQQAPDLPYAAAPAALRAAMLLATAVQWKFNDVVAGMLHPDLRNSLPATWKARKLL